MGYPSISSLASRSRNLFVFCVPPCFESEAPWIASREGERMSKEMRREAGRFISFGGTDKKTLARVFSLALNCFGRSKKKTLFGVGGGGGGH